MNRNGSNLKRDGILIISFDQFHPISDALAKWNAKVVIDGEIVVLGADGRSDFSAIRKALITIKQGQYHLTN